MRVLVTGGGGFLGAWIIRRLLDSGADVRIFDASADRKYVSSICGERHASIDWHLGDIVDFDQVAAAVEGCDVIIHLAGVQTPFCSERPLLGAQINILGTLNVFEAAKRHAVSRVIYTSSGAVFGPDNDAFPEPITHYGAYKLANEGSARAYWFADRISSVGMRPFVIYGPGRDKGLTATVTEACLAAATGEPYTITLEGQLPLVFVEDVADAYMLALQNMEAGAHTVDLPGQPVSMDEIIEVIRDVVPAAVISSRGPCLPSVTELRSASRPSFLGAVPGTPLEVGIRRTVEFYREHGPI